MHDLVVPGAGLKWEGPSAVFTNATESCKMQAPLPRFCYLLGKPCHATQHPRNTAGCEEPIVCYPATAILSLHPEKSQSGFRLAVFTAVLLTKLELASLHRRARGSNPVVSMLCSLFATCVMRMACDGISEPIKIFSPPPSQVTNFFPFSYCVLISATA